MISLSTTDMVITIPMLLLIEGFFSGSEIALLSADKLSLRRDAKTGQKRSILALELANHPERVFSTTLLITSICVISTSALIAFYFIERSGHLAEIISVLVTSPLVVILGELLPKTFFQRHADRLAPWVAYPVYGAYWVFLPITHLLASYTTRLSRIVGPIEELLAGKKKTTREEIRSLLSYTKSETDIKTSEKQIIDRIFDFRYSEAQHALIPLVQVDAISELATVQEALERFELHRHSRMPVYSERIDNIIGLVEIVDLLTAAEPKMPIRNFITPAHYVAEAQPLEDLMVDMHRDDIEMVVVVDEHGGAVGILTFEDIVEEIVGEISDEYDSESLPYKILSDNQWLVQAKMEIQHINQELKLDLPEGDYETLSGFLLQQFGRIPKTADELYFNTSSGSFRFRIRKASDRHIETVLIEQSDLA